MKLVLLHVHRDIQTAAEMLDPQSGPSEQVTANRVKHLSKMNVSEGGRDVLAAHILWHEPTAIWLVDLHHLSITSGQFLTQLRRRRDVKPRA